MEGECVGTMDAAGGPTPKSKAVDYYEVLGVTQGASKLKIREAYLRLKETYDGEGHALYSLISEDSAKAALSEIEEAFAILNDDFKRAEFDRAQGYAAPVDGQAHAQEERIQALRPRELDGGSVEARAPRLSSVVPITATAASDDDLQKAILQMVSEGDPGDGDLYRRIRERAGVSIDEMHERTKVSAGFISAIESNRFENLPAPVFVRGFLRSYLRYLGVGGADGLVKAFAGRYDEWLGEKGHIV